MSWRLPASIMSRLAVLFGFIVILIISLLGTYLYHSLASQLEARDDEELIGKVVQIRHLLQEVGFAREIERSPFAFLDAVFGHEGLAMRISSIDGRAMVQNAGWNDSVRPSRFVPADREPTAADITSGKLGRAPARVVGALGAVGATGAEQVSIMLARDGSARRRLLAVYFRDLSLAGLVAVLLSAMLGYMTLRHGLSPVGAVARKANEITSRRLDMRIALDEAPRELREMTSAFNGMLDRLEDSVKRLAGFAGDLAHDVRTPLTALMVKTEVGLSRSRTAEEYHAILESNMEEYHRLSRLIENTLFLARAENAQLALDRQAIDLGVELQKIAEYFSGLAEEAGIEVTHAGESVLFADPVLFDRAVSNLLSNAIRYSDRGSVVHLGASEEAGEIVVVVENRGKPVPEDQLHLIFEPYFRGDPSRTGTEGTAGLGLAIVRSIMKLHGGAAHATCEGGMTRFVLRFPIANRPI